MSTTLHTSDLPGLELLHRGKVRDVFALPDNALLMVASDRLSAFDVVLPDPIPGKGEMLTQMSNFWFARTAHLIPNHLLDTPVAQVLQTAMEMAAERGKVLLVGSPPGTATIGLQVELLRRELSIIGTYEVGIDEPHGYWPWSRRRNRQICLRLLSTGQLSFQHLITHVRPAAETEAMFRTMHDGTTPWMGIVFTWDDLSAFR